MGNMKFPVGTLVRFDWNYFADSSEFLSYIGTVIPPANPQKTLRIIWEDGRIEEYGEKFESYFEVVE
jgi:hypothetical protein